MLRSEDSFEEFEENSRGSIQVENDPLQTIRPYPAKAPSAEPSKSRSSTRRQPSKVQQASALQNVPILTQNPAPAVRRARPAALYKENSVEDYTDLIMANEDVLDRKLGVFQVCSTFNKNY
jgi:hypothetical protein